MKVRYNGPSDEFSFIDGRVYEAKKMYKDYYGVLDEIGDCSLVAKKDFIIVEGSEEDLDWYGNDPNDPTNLALIHEGKKSE